MNSTALYIKSIKSKGTSLISNLYSHTYKITKEVIFTENENCHDFTQITSQCTCEERSFLFEGWFHFSLPGKKTKEIGTPSSCVPTVACTFSTPALVTPRMSELVISVSLVNHKCSMVKTTSHLCRGCSWQAQNLECGRCSLSTYVYVRDED